MYWLEELKHALEMLNDELYLTIAAERVIWLLCVFFIPLTESEYIMSQ